MANANFVIEAARTASVYVCDLRVHFELAELTMQADSDPSEANIEKLRMKLFHVRAAIGQCAQHISPSILDGYLNRLI